MRRTLSCSGDLPSRAPEASGQSNASWDILQPKAKAPATERGESCSGSNNNNSNNTGSRPVRRSSGVNLLTQRAQALLLGADSASGGSSVPGEMLPDVPLPIGRTQGRNMNGPSINNLSSSMGNLVQDEDSNDSMTDVSDVSSPLPNHMSSRQGRPTNRRMRSRIYDDPATVAGYAAVPLIEIDRLPRGGISLDTEAVGRIQFGIPPETIKDSMRLGFGVPSVYIVPVERFCREMGPALGINLAEFEFPAYFNYFIRMKRCTLVVDSDDAENNIRRVFGETLLGPAIFRNHDNPLTNEDEDFDPSFQREARPNFYKEFYHFRTAEESSNYEELTIDMLLDFCHFKGSQQSRPNASGHVTLGVPPPPPEKYGSGDEMHHSESRRRHTTFGISEDENDGSATRAMPVPEDHEVCDSLGTEEDNLGEQDLDKERPIFRRTRSDPDIKKRLSLNALIQSIPASPDKEANSAISSTEVKKPARRGSIDSMGSFMSKGGRSRDGMSWADGASFMLASDDEDDPSRNSWMYSQAKWLGEVATVYPPTATEEDRATNRTPRVEIFKMTGGTEYIVHDIDENNDIVGKARFSGTVRVPDEMAVEGFLATDMDSDRVKASAVSKKYDDDFEGDDSDDDSDSSHSQQGIQFSIPRPVIPPTFHPPSFGVTVLGNSHGFDKNGSTSGYVLWINGRGVMIDPPPYSSATLEREGIRPQMIMAIMITHCHADHDAGTFQKVMTGSRVAIITTPTIYKSFIRKYAALSGLSPALLRHSHRHRPAIVGQPLKFQGATFNFTYTLHTIPCIAFKVEWRGRSMVFTGDHLNSPPMIDSLEKMGVLAKERADDLRRLPLQECDVLLHEAGAPPIHTPLSVLTALPERVKQRLYVVHTSALPSDCDLRVAPTGTAGTIRLDQLNKPATLPVSNKVNGAMDYKTDESNGQRRSVETSDSSGRVTRPSPSSAGKKDGLLDIASLDDGGYPNLTVAGDFVAPCTDSVVKQQSAGERDSTALPPLVFLRPTCVSDAWFILNLLSAVPFLSSLSYANTMEVLEIAQVEMFCANQVVIPAHRRGEVLCVVWEGTCVEREPSVEGGNLSLEEYSLGYDQHPGASELDMHNETLLYVESGDGLLRRFNPTVWHAGDWTGPLALQPDTERSAEVPNGETSKDVVALSAEGVKVIMLNMKDLHEILKNGSKLFRKYLSLKEKQAAEEAAMKAQIMRNEILAQTDLNYLSTNGEGYRIEDQVPNHWYAYDSVLEVLKCNSALGKLTALQKRHLESLAEGPRFFEAGHYLWRVGQPVDYAFLIVTGTGHFASKPEEQRIFHRRCSTGNMFPISDRPRREALQIIEEDKQLINVPPNSEYARLEIGLQLRVEEMELDVYDQSKDLMPKEERMRNARDRFANKVLARLYSRRAYTAGLVFSRGHLLSDTSRMVSGSLAHIHHSTRREEKIDTSSVRERTRDHHCHTSNMMAGPEGCVVMVFPRSSLVQFLDGNPGVLLSLLGTQVVV